MRYQVQKRIAITAKLPSGVRVGNVWETVATYKRRATAERVAQNLRQDFNDNAIRTVVK
jgi:hypothetical protein